MTEISKKAPKLMLLISGLILLIFITAGCGPQAKQGANEDEKVPVIRVSHQPSYDAWATFDAVKTEFDKENGVELKMVFFDSGMPQIEALPAEQWDIGATGTVPSLLAALRFGAYVIAVSDDESMVNTVMVRSDSPLLKTKGYNPEYPDIYGSPEDLKGKDVFVTTVSGGHFVLAKYLQALGLTEDNVNIMNMEQASIVSAFDSGKGDIATLWAPFLYTGLEKGWSLACSGDQVEAGNPMFVVVSKKFADEHPDLVVKWLDIYLQKANELKENEKDLVTAYQQFNKDWGAQEFSDSFAINDMEKHVVYNLEEELALFDKSSGTSHVEEVLTGIINFFAEQGKFTPEEQEQLLKFEFINDEFLKALAKEKGIL